MQHVDTLTKILLNKKTMKEILDQRSSRSVSTDVIHPEEPLPPIPVDLI